MKNFNPLIILITLFITNVTQAQVAIGTTYIEDGIIFKTETEDKGLLLPRVQLVSRNSTSPLPTNIPSGTVVFNTQTTGTFPNIITTGIHWWSAEENQWTNISVNLKNVLVKYTNSENSINYNQLIPQNVSLFGNKIINESSSIYEVNSGNQEIKVNVPGLFSISSLLSFDRSTADGPGRVVLTARVYVNNLPVGTEQIINSGYTTSINGDRGLFSHSFTEYITLKEGDVVSVKIARAAGIYANNYGNSVVKFLRSGDSSISLLRIR